MSRFYLFISFAFVEFTLFIPAPLATTVSVKVTVFKPVVKLNLHVRGRSDKYLDHKRKTKILEKWRFISQYNLLLARYT